MKYKYYEPYTHIMKTEEGIIEFIKSKQNTPEGYTRIRCLLQGLKVMNFYSNITPVYALSDSEFGTPAEKEIMETSDLDYRIVTPRSSWDLYEGDLRVGERIVDIKQVGEGVVELCVEKQRKTPKTVKYRFNSETGAYEKASEPSVKESLRLSKKTKIEN